MLKLLPSRLMTAIPSIVGVVVVTFMLTRLLPGDPAAYFAGLAATRRRSPRSAPSSASTSRCPSSSSPISATWRTAISAISLSTGQPVVAEIVTRLPASAELTLVALFLAVAIAIPWACWRR